MSLHRGLGWIYRLLLDRFSQRDPEHGLGDLDALLAGDELPSRIAERRERLTTVAEIGGEVA